MKRLIQRFLITSAMLLFGNSLFGQPLPCEEPPMMTPFCDQACVICDIDGFEGINNEGDNGEAPASFCTSTVHNGRWIAFIAGSENLRVRMSVSNCVTGWGLELGIYEGINCSNFNLVSNCDGSVGENTSAIFETNTPLTIGQYYYIVMDGNGGDVCNWTFEVLEGSTQVDPLSTSGLLSGNLNACPNNPQIYTTTSQTGATEFAWTIDGETVQEGEEKSLEVTWPENGNYQLCVTASNACDEAPPTCQTIQVQSIPTTNFNETICNNESYEVNDTISLTTAGSHLFNFPTFAGCDSFVRVTLEVIEATFTDIEANICDGDSIFIGTTPYFSDGAFVETIPNSASCDSTINLDLNIIICEMQGTISETPTVCFNEPTGQLHFQVTDGTPPFNYTWEQLGTAQTGSGEMTNVDELYNLSGLPTGTYLININDLFGNDLVLIQEITEPPILTAELTASDYNGVNVSCGGSSDAILTAFPAGGIAPYQYVWSSGDLTQISENLAAETYTVTITDEFGCTLIISESLTAPNPLQFNATFTDPNCDGLETGILEVNNAFGGTAPYLFDQSGNGFTSNQLFDNLPAGTYTLTIQDANGCQTDTTATITAPIIPVIDLGENPLIFLGDAITLDISSNVALDNVLWSSIGELNCTDCPNPIVRPFDATTYTVQVISEDGCATEASVTVNVEKRRRVAVPTAFSPNQDGINDRFAIIGGPEVSEVLNFQIYSRWGELIYSQTNFQLEDAQASWDGFYELRPAQNGVYAWTAEIAFIDGEVLSYSGNLILLK